MEYGKNFKKLVELVPYPYSMVTVKCKFRANIGRPELVGEDACVCLKPTGCDCVSFGRTLREDIDSNQVSRIPHTDEPLDPADNFLMGN